MRLLIYVSPSHYHYEKKEIHFKIQIFNFFHIHETNETYSWFAGHSEDEISGILKTDDWKLVIITISKKMGLENGEQTNFDHNLTHLNWWAILNSYSSIISVHGSCKNVCRE